MNDTNRALNRVVIFLVGLVLLVVGAAAGALLFWPWWATQWEDVGQTVETAVTDALEATPLQGAEYSWWYLAALAVLVVLVIVMIAIIASVGGGGSREIYRKPVNQRDESSDRLLIDTSFAAEALKHSLDKRTDLVSSTVGAFTVKRRPVLHVGITPRQGVSPRLLSQETDVLVNSLAMVVGDTPATCLTIHSGLRAKLGRDQRVR